MKMCYAFIYSCVSCCVPVHVAYMRVSSCLLLMDMNVYICSLTYQWKKRKEEKLRASKETGPENLPLKAVIALMAAAAAAVLSRLAKDPRTGSISLSHSL